MKKDFAKPVNPSAPNVPSEAAVLQAESKTSSALRLSKAISLVLSKPSLSSVILNGGVKTNAGSVSPFISPLINPCVAKLIIFELDKLIDLTLFSFASFCK